MITYIITGTSSGIGEALAKQCLEKGNHVIGLSRRVPSFSNEPNYEHIEIDLEQTQALAKIDWLSFNLKNEIILINNAGIVGEIDRSENLSAKHFVKMSNVNIVAPQVLCASLLSAYKNQVSNIINISSGAGRKAIASWSAYCASKAALDLFSEVLQQELLELGRSTRVFSLAPGVIDTEMQDQIREANLQVFSSHEKFVEMKKDSALSSPKEVASKILLMLEFNIAEVITDLRDI